MVKNVCGAVTVACGVVCEVHRILNHEVMLVHLRQLIE